MTRFPLFALALAALMACQSPLSRPDPGPVDFTPSCGAGELQGLIGQDAGIIAELEIKGALRVIHPGMAVTADYRPDRLNIAVDDGGLITRVWCV
ncbi:I78 family peptidase inhibitor [Aliiroseovarius subalbicans]|uniref:I78 family peptidase inhibitor n=1 Tax=Aliiroseovarius subalbicans TaxID=2925840 RepID=UPI001F55ECA4|nr:I78 family peptidase inhibitor [Aliiroseovarius subalbicans]MCI2399470.1 I78 family peptidase inhibitor [Aliiroseovarius subalbicans]